MAGLTDAFIQNNENISEDEAANKIIASLTEEMRLKEIMKNDERLIAARQLVKDLASGYKAAIKLEKEKRKFLLGKIEEIKNNKV